MRPSPGTRDPWNAIIADPPVEAPLGRRLLVKDSIDATGFPTRAGSPALRDHPATASAPVVQRLVDAGFVVIGKANMHELSFGVTSVNAWLGAVRNPADPSRIPGGSSGGTAAALAADLADAGLGGDTGGSLRIPAALCGVAGFRPSTGRYPKGGAIGLSPTRDVLGPMARTVEELEILDRILCGRTDAIAPTPLAGLRIGLPRAPFFKDIDRQTAGALDTALSALADAGCDLVELDLGKVEALQPILDFPIAGFEIAGTMRELAEVLGLETEHLAERIADPGVREAVAALGRGHGPKEADYRTAMEVRAALRGIYRRTFAESRIAALVFPCVPIVAPSIGEDLVMVGGRQVSVFEALTRNCWPASVADLPALCLPAPAAGLPVGLEIDGPEGGDDRVIAIGLALEVIFSRR
jgi:Asp-tRNA(Asn)/Glu-tRNA(Gln) amidotransferase A subunit family amidase